MTDYLTSAEQAVVRDADSAERDRLANLMWSAKESALKVLRTGLRRDTRSVEVRLAAETGAGGWTALRIDAEEGRSFPGWWRQFGVFLVTVAAEGPVSRPQSVIDPPGLAAGVPTESWLAAPLVEAGTYDHRNDPISDGYSHNAYSGSAAGRSWGAASDSSGPRRRPARVISSRAVVPASLVFW